MSDKQKAAMRAFTCGRVYAAIQAIYADLPSRFTTLEVERKAKLKGMGSMLSAIGVLERTFHCTRNAQGVWRKPESFIHE